MSTSCIRTPENNRYIQLFDWQVKFCQQNHCAALLLSYFSGWHDWKIRNDQYYRRFNDIAEMHGDARTQNENAYLFFTTDQLIEGCMSLYGKKAITAGLELLASLRVISVHKNPNRRYLFDKTKYFQFYPKICNRWIAENYPIKEEEEENHTEVSDYYDSAKIADRDSQNDPLSGGSAQPTGQSNRAITDTTNNTTNKNQSLKTRERICDDFEQPILDKAGEDKLHLVVDALAAKGLLRKQFYPDALAEIGRLMQLGATVDLFCEAFDIAFRSTQGGRFGVNYIAKVVADLLAKSKKEPPYSANSKPERKQIYENDFSKGLAWMGDLIK